MQKFYVAEPAQYPMIQKFDFSISKEERKALNEVKTLFRLEMLNKFGNGWRKIAKPKKIAIV